MVLNRNLVRQGNVLLKAGTVLTHVSIEALKKWGISHLDIVGEETHEVALTDWRNDPDYTRERQELESLFSAMSEHDGQMELLKYCLISQLEERYGAEC